MNIKEQNSTVIMELKGKLAGGSLSDRIDQTLGNLLAQGKKNFVIDLGSITSMNSSGMGILISSFSKVTDNGGTLKFANVTDKIRGVLSNTKLNEIFEVYSTTEEAVKSFN